MLIIFRIQRVLRGVHTLRAIHVINATGPAAKPHTLMGPYRVAGLFGPQSPRPEMGLNLKVDILSRKKYHFVASFVGGHDLEEPF
jgi:hypothetical protein